MDVHFLDYDGGLVDASCIAVVSALQHFRRPEVKVEGEEVALFTLAERAPVPLSLLHHPYCVTLSFFHGGEVVLVDATLKEQQLSEGEMIVTANRQGEVCQIAKLGGVPVDAIFLLRCVQIAVSQAALLSKTVAAALNEDSTKRNVGGLMAELKSENER